MKCERCGKELSGLDLYCERCGKAIFPEYMDEADIWAYYKTDEELAEILKTEEGQEQEAPKKSLWETALLKEQETFMEESDPEGPESESEPKPETSEVECRPEEEETEAEPKTEESETECELEAEVSEAEHEPEAEVSEAEESESEQETEKADESEAESEEEEKESESIEEAEAETVKEPEEDKEVLSDQEEWDFSDEEEDEEEEEAPPLTPEMKKARRLRRGLISVFLILCLGTGIYLGFHRVKKMEQQEKEYYDNLENSSSQETIPMEELDKTPETPEEEKEKEPSKEETPEELESPKENTPKEEPKKEYFKLENTKDIDFSKYKKLQAAGTEENSVKESESYDYSAKSAVDGDVSTSWQENEEGGGEGKGFKITLDGNHKIRYMVFHLGNWRSDQLWDYNARPKTLTVQVGDQQKKDVEFSDEKKTFCLSFDEPVEASYVSLYIKETYKGSRWQDNCISEVELYE